MRISWNTNKAQWKQNTHEGPLIPLVTCPTGGFRVPLPESALPDPHAGPLFAGYLVTQNRYKTKLEGTKLTINGAMSVTPGAVFNFMSESNNVGTDPAGFRPFIKTNAWDINFQFDRWWSDTRYVLKDDPMIRLKVSLDPSTWFAVDGTRADDPIALPSFRAAIACPSFVGLTFGGGYFAGHGVNVSGGSAHLDVIQFYTE